MRCCLNAERSVFRQANVFHRGRSRRAEAKRRLALLLDRLLVDDAGKRCAQVGRDVQGWSILLRRGDLCSGDDVGDRVDSGCLHTQGARPDPVTPLHLPLEAGTVSLVDLAPVVATAALGT